MGSSFLMCDDIEKVVDTIAEIDVGGSSCSKHHLSSFSSSILVGVAGFIFRPFVGFGFSDDSACEETVKLCEEKFS